MAMCMGVASVLPMGMTALAASVPLAPDAAQSVTVNGLEQGVKVDLYKVVDVNIKGNQLVYPLYAWNDNEQLKEWLEEYDTEHQVDYIGDNGELNNAFQQLGNNTSQSRQFWNELAGDIKSGHIVLSSSYNATSSDTGSVTFSQVSPGEYIAVATNTQNGVKVYRPTTVTVLPTYHTEEPGGWYIDDLDPISMKSSSPFITKTVDEQSIGSGDTVNYRVTAVIPDYPENAAYNDVIIADALDETLALNSSSITVEDAQEGIDYSLDTENASVDGENYTFIITFTDSFIEQNAGQEVTVTYSANATKDVAQFNENTAVLVYNHDPYTSQHQFKDSTVDVYSYGIVLTKVNEQGEALTDVEFELYKANETHTGVEGLPLAFTAEAGTYQYNPNAQEGTDTVLSTDRQGKVSVTGLDTGYYFFKETKASESDQYIVPDSMILVYMDDSNDTDGSLDQADASVEGNDNVISIVDGTVSTTQNLLLLTVRNTVLDNEGLVLPVTGGMGTMIFTIAGILLMAGGASMIVVILRKRRV